jgi:hypothetical protein
VQIGGRDFGTVTKALFEQRHYHAARNMLRLYDRPVDMCRCYLTRTRDYPFTARVRTPMGWLDVELYSPDDVRTINEIFCREDYLADRGDTVVVDFGSNIGVFDFAANPLAVTHTHSQFGHIAQFHLRP